MNSKILWLIIILLAVGGFWYFSNENNTEPEGDMHTEEQEHNEEISVTPISHATAVIEWDGTVIYTDPVGGEEAFTGQPEPSLVLVTDIHGDHLSPETLEAVMSLDTTIVAPQAVADELPENLLAQTVVLANGQIANVVGFTIEAIPMYNLPDQGVEIRHEKGRGNGYVLELNDTRVYIAGDTADIPEMRALENIDYAFIPMNMPYTMTVEDATSGVLAFAPHHVYPYHYRGQDGLSDIQKFKQLVNDGNQDIEVILLDWYSE